MSCGDSVLAGTAPGEPRATFATWLVVGPALGGTGASASTFGVVVSWFWEYGVQPAFLAAV